MSTAKNIAPAFLISALNILNEAEINYKAARNKRLHVELVLIKLCYLQQAIELTSDAGGISKKKIVESSLAFRTAAIKPLKVESQKSEVNSRESEARSQQSEAKLVIETSFVKEETANYKTRTSNFSKESLQTSNLKQQNFLHLIK